MQLATRSLFPASPEFRRPSPRRISDADADADADTVDDYYLEYAVQRGRTDEQRLASIAELYSGFTLVHGGKDENHESFSELEREFFAQGERIAEEARLHELELAALMSELA